MVETRRSSPRKENGPSSPNSSIFYTPGKTSSIFNTPTRSGSRSQLQLEMTNSTVLSPSKRGTMNFTKGSPRRELQEEANGTSAIFKAPSPVKTPNGRAGLPSPKRRGIFDLDKSARKRAFKSTSAYSQLMNDGTDDFDYLEEQDRELAGRIIRESKRAKINDKDEDSEEEYIRAYGSDVELEEDHTETPKTRRRTHAEKKKDVQPKPKPRSRRRATVDKVKSEDQDESDEADDIDDEEDSDVEVNDEDVEDEESAEDEEEEEEEEDDDEDEEEEEEEELQASPTRSRRRQRNDIGLDEEISPRKVGRPRTREIKEKRRVGRPSKADKVISQVKSIFQMDDDAFFQENKSPQKKDLSKSPQKRANVPLVNFNNTGDSKYSKIPVVSGITQENEDKKDNVPFEENDFQTRFTPMPIPELDENGEIIDKEYVEKYFPRSNLELKFKGKLADERAFFLEGSEGYFEQHNTRVKASAGSLSQSAPHIEYDEFLPYVKLSELVRKQERANICELHRSLYHQWCFELTQSFNLNFYGIGSKINLILDFVENYLIDWYEEIFDDDYPEILVVNGYNPATKLKTIMLDIASALIPQETKKANNLKFPKHVSETVPFLIEFMNQNREPPTGKNNIIRPKLILTIHNIDGESLRDEKTQSLLSQLCSLPEIWLISSVDNVNASLLWDSFRLKNYNFIWHDLTNYNPYSIELSFKDILSVGKSKKFVGSKGAKFVLTSLTPNARKLYQLLINKQMEIMKHATQNKAGLSSLRGNIKFAIGFKEFYAACTENFVLSHENAFRTILGEFVEHKMCTLTKDDSGTEVVFIPFSFAEMEQLLKENVLQ